MRLVLFLFHLFLPQLALLLTDLGVGDIDLLHLFHRLFGRLVQADQRPAGQHHDDHKDQQHHRHLGAGGAEPVQQRQSEDAGHRAAPVPVDAVLEQGEKLFNQVAVGDAAAEHLGGAAEQADEQHGLPDLVPHQADGLVQGGHDRDVKEQRSDEVGAPAKHPEKEVMYPVPDILPLDQGGGHDEHRHSKDDDCPELLAGVRLAVLSLLFACGGAFAAGRSFFACHIISP